jgi:hypothetical protein
MTLPESLGRIGRTLSRRRSGNGAGPGLRDAGRELDHAKVACGSSAVPRLRDSSTSRTFDDLNNGGATPSLLAGLLAKVKHTTAREFAELPVTPRRSLSARGRVPPRHGEQGWWPGSTGCRSARRPAGRRVAEEGESERAPQMARAPTRRKGVPRSAARAISRR